MLVLYVALAGAVGALSRWWLSIFMQRWLGVAFPYGTLAVNLIGCFLLGCLLAVAEHSRWLTNESRVVLAVGFIGTFSTFSAFADDTLQLARRGNMAMAMGNVAVNVALGLVLLWMGSMLTARLVR